MARHVVDLINPFNPQIYCEPFCGGSSVFFALGKADNRIDVLNDKNRSLICFYEAAKKYPKSLRRMIEATLYSDDALSQAQKVLKEASLENLSKQEILRIGHAAYISVCLSYKKKLDSGSLATHKNPQKPMPQTFRDRKTIISAMCDRLDECFILNRDAIEVINQWDSDRTLFFIDPPYIGTNCAHYGTRFNTGNQTEKFDRERFSVLVDTLSRIKGKYILTHNSDDFIPVGGSVIKTVNLRVTGPRGRDADHRLETFVSNL